MPVVHHNSVPSFNGPTKWKTPKPGVWSPGGTKESESSSPLIRDSGHNGTSSTKPEEPILPVWTPTTAPSPNSERKFRPVNFNAPASPKLSGGAARSSSLERAPSPPKREIVRSASWNQSPGVYTPQQQGHHPPQPPSLHQTPENHPFSSSQLPKYQNPTITLLQKAREGQLPKGAHYLDHKTPPLVRSTSASGIPPHTRPGNFQSRAAAFNPSETLYEVRGVEEGRPTVRSIEYTPRKFQGTGPTTPDGVPLALRAGIKGEQQHEFYKRWYQSLHVDKPNKSGRSPYGGGGQNSGSWSEPEGYESDSYAYNRYATLDRRKLRDRNFEADYFSPEPFSPTSSTVPGIRFQPGRIEDYTPGAASSAPVRVQRVKSSPQWGIGKDLGYESDSNLIIRKREEVQSTPPPPPLSPLEQRQVYVDIQKGGEVPLQGLRKPAPEKNRALSPVKYAESEVNIHYKAPVRLEEKDYIGEEELRQRQQAAMKKFYEDQRHRKFLQEIQDIENRRHTYNVIPSQKSPIPLNRYEDAIDESQSPRWRERTPEPKYAARALYNFVAQNPRELNFRKGDILFLQKKLDKNWYRATCYGGEGLVPANYVEIIQSHNGDRATPNVPSEGQAKVRFNFVAASPAEMSIAKGETIVLTRRVDPNWYEGRIANRSGIFPVSYVQVLKEPGAVNSSLSPKPIGAPAARTLIPSQNGSEMYQGSHHYNPIHQYSMKTDVGNIQNSRRQQSSINGHSSSGLNHDLTIDTRNDTSTYRAIYNYLPANNDELELCENDVIQVFEKCDDGWYVGVSVRTGLFGTFPGNYVERIY